MHAMTEVKVDRVAARLREQAAEQKRPATYGQLLAALREELFVMPDTRAGEWIVAASEKHPSLVMVIAADMARELALVRQGTRKVRDGLRHLGFFDV